MKKIIASWVGKEVHVTLRATVPTPMKEKLLEVDESGIVLEAKKGWVFVPVTSILHITLLKPS